MAMKSSSGFSQLASAADEGTGQTPSLPASPQPWEGGTAAPEKHPVYDSQEGEDPDTGHAHLLHDIGSTIQDMFGNDPAQIKAFMDKMMGPGIDYEGESKRLRSLIESRKMPQRPNWVASGVGSWAGGPQTAERFRSLEDRATGAEAMKSEDLLRSQEDLIKEHAEDLRSRGKTGEALIMGLASGALAQRRVETQQQGALSRAHLSADTREDLQDRALGAASERVRMRIQGMKDIKDKDRTQEDVMHVYETLLKAADKDVAGATKARYTPEQAMDMALKTILPQVKPGVSTVKTGEAPAGAQPTAAAKPTTGQSKFAQWKAQQATARK